MNEKVLIRRQIAAMRILVQAAERRMPLKGSEISHLKPQWEAAILSLEWLQSNEETIKSALKRNREG